MPLSQAGCRVVDMHRSLHLVGQESKSGLWGMQLASAKACKCLSEDAIWCIQVGHAVHSLQA